MNPELQIKAIAELDGVKIFRVSNQDDPGFQFFLNCHSIPKNSRELKPSEWPEHWVGQKPYLTSRDAIVPVIEKQPREVQVKICQFIECGFFDELTWYCAAMIMIATPSQLCEALLRATGKWKE